MNTSRPFTFDRVVRILAGLALLAGAIWMINKLRNVLLPFCVACLIAYLLEPLVELNKRGMRLKGRALAVVMTLLEATVVIGLLWYFFVPSIIDEIGQIGELIKNSRTSNVTVPFIPDNIADQIRQWISSIDLADILSGSHMGSLLSSGTSLIASTIDFLLHTLEWLLTFIYVIFIMIDYRSLMSGFRMLVPKRYRKVAYKIGDDIKDSMNRYFRSQALIALCAAVLYCIGFSIVGIPLAIVLGIMVGILYLIPYFQYITLIPVALVCLIDSMTGTAHFWPELGQCILVYVVSQSICDYVLTPKIMGHAMGLNPAIILLSLSVWGSLMDIIGMIIALPMTTLLLAYYQQYVVGDKPAANDASPTGHDPGVADGGA